jgi:uncharacterized lipoprotein YajG
MKLIRLALVLVILSMSSGCAFQAQAVKITPEIKSTSSVSGEGKSVQLVILDERPSQIVGQRGAGTAGADMTVDGDLQGIVAKAISDGLAQRRFAAQTQDSHDLSRLRVEIRNLQSKNIVGFWAGTLRDEFSLKAVCKPVKGADYEQMYNGLYETSIQVVPTGDANNRYVSAAVSDAVNKLVNDDQLLRCLAE